MQGGQSDPPVLAVRASEGISPAEAPSAKAEACPRCETNGRNQHGGASGREKAATFEVLGQLPLEVVGEAPAVFGDEALGLLLDAALI